MAAIPAITIRDVSEAIIQGVDPSILPRNSVYLAVNLDFHSRIGSMVVRDGTTQVGSQVTDGMACLGLHNHITGSGTKVPLAVFNASGGATAVLSKFTAAAWSSAQTGLTADAKVRFVTFLGTTALLQAGNATQYSSANGSTWVSTGGNLDIANIPDGSLAEEFKDRVFVAGVSGNLDRLYYSSVASGGTISWTAGNGFIDIEPEEGAGPITALSKVPGYLLIFKERSMKRWDSKSTFPESMVTIGAPSQEAVVKTKVSVYYFNKRGIYETTGGYPRRISRRIQDIIAAVPASYYSSVSGWGDGESVYFSLGDITIDGLTISNCVVRYYIESQTWTTYSYPNEFKRWNVYVDSNGDDTVMAGDDDGNVWLVGSGTIDGTATIKWTVQYQNQECGFPEQVKTISEVTVLAEKVSNGTLWARTLRNGGDFDVIGNVAGYVSEIKQSHGGNTIEYRMSGESASGSAIISLQMRQIDVALSQTT